MNQSLSNTEKLIEQLDKTALSLASQQYLNARDNDTRKEWKKKVDDLLDARLDLMKTRDKKK